MKEKPSLFKFMWINNLETSIEELKTMAMLENWGENKEKQKYPILFNYLFHTFEKIIEEDKIEIQEECSIFNIGLVTENQEEIFGYCKKNKKPDSTIPWYFLGWRRASDRELGEFSKLPETANYIENASDLIYDTNIELRVNIDHIIEDNKTRFPAPFNKMDNYQLGNILKGTIDDAKKRVKRNYKTAIPQYFKGKLQLLLPLCLSSKSKADLALVIEKINDTYRASTCLTLDMAINNARLIAKPDDEWLKI